MKEACATHLPAAGRGGGVSPPQAAGLGRIASASVAVQLGSGLRGAAAGGLLGGLRDAFRLLGRMNESAATRRDSSDERDRVRPAEVG